MYNHDYGSNDASAPDIVLQQQVFKDTFLVDSEDSYGWMHIVKLFQLFHPDKV